MENHLGLRVLKASGMHGPLEVHKDSSMPAPNIIEMGSQRVPDLIPGMLYSALTLTLDVSNFPNPSWPGGPPRSCSLLASCLANPKRTGAAQTPLLPSQGQLLGPKSSGSRKAHGPQGRCTGGGLVST